MDEQNLIAKLRQIRRTLRDAVNGTGTIEEKMLGPRPKSAGEPKMPNPDCVANFIGQISDLSIQLDKWVSMHSEHIGSFVEEGVESANPRLG